MGTFSKKSKERLDTCHPDLQVLFEEVNLGYECSILEGSRGQEEQDEAYRSGKSKLQYPDSKHNIILPDRPQSLAVDVAPWPIDWGDIRRFYHFAGYVLKTAEQLGIKVRWGGDWDSDKDFKDQVFMDLVHWELIDG